MAVLVTDTPATVLAVYAHPDDPDVSAGGTLARWAAAGAAVHVCICADGDKGSSDPDADPTALVGLRRQEVSASGIILGVKVHHWLGFRDGELDDQRRLRARLVALVREVCPDAVVAPDPTAVFFGHHYINHLDHRQVGWAALDAVAPAAGNPHYFPDAGPAHRVGLVYLSGTLEPDIWVDISETIDVKAAAIACHESQVGDNGEWLRSAVRQRAEDAGREANVRFAEGYRRIQLA
ncbi:MAG TPA: PIG-L deacetylase family protein [Acidimicrobiales bacterium]